MPLVAAHPGQQQAPQSSRQRERGEGGKGGRGLLVEGGELVKGYGGMDDGDGEEGDDVGIGARDVSGVSEVEDGAEVDGAM